MPAKFLLWASGWRVASCNKIKKIERGKHFNDGSSLKPNEFSIRLI